MKQTRAERRSARKNASLAAPGAGEKLISEHEAALLAAAVPSAGRAAEKSEYSARIAEHLIQRDLAESVEAAAEPVPLTTLRAISEMENYLAIGGDDTDVEGFLSYLEAVGIR
jgi:hypothetical protein